MADMINRYTRTLKRSRDIARRGTDCAQALKRRDWDDAALALVRRTRDKARLWAARTEMRQVADDGPADAVTARLRYQDSLMVQDGCVQSPTGALVFCMAD